MAAQKHRKKNCCQKFFAFLNAHKPKTQLIKALSSIDFSRSYGRLSQNPKTGGFRELDFGGLETNQRHKVQFITHALLHKNSTYYKNCFGHLIGRYSNCSKF